MRHGFVVFLAHRGKGEKLARSLEKARQGRPPVARAPEHDAPPLLPPSALSNVARLLVSEESPDRVLHAVAEALSECIPFDRLTLYQTDTPLRQLRPVVARDRYGEIASSAPVAFGAGMSGMAAESGVAQLVNDAHLDPRIIRVPGAEVEAESLLAVPLMARGELTGVLSMRRQGEGNHFTLREYELAVLFGDLAALAIEGARVRSRLQSEVATDHLTVLYNHRYFQERLAEEVRRANRHRTSVSLILFDVDDFKRVNDTFGHEVGDQVLQGVAALCREACRQEDVICRIGGEEFGIILPGSELEDAVVLAERLRQSIAETPFPVAGPVTVSVGAAQSPRHAASARELITCVELALFAAKGDGKNRVNVYVDETEAALELRTPHAMKRPGDGQGFPRGDRARLAVLETRGEHRSAAQLRMLQSLSTKLNRLTQVREIGELITAELRTLIDYHNCRVHLLHPDGETLVPVAFRGELLEYQGETFDALITKVGKGITGHVAQSGRSHYAPDAARDSFAVNIPGTPDVDESILAVPMRYRERVVGTIVLSKLGIDQFDEEDRRLLEALAGSAAVALENARLFEMEREAAELSSSLLRLSQALTGAGEVEEVLALALAEIPTMLACSFAGVWIVDRDSGEFRLRAHTAVDPEVAERVAGHGIPYDLGMSFILASDRPFVLLKEVVAQVPKEYTFLPEPLETLVAPIRWEPDGFGAIVVASPPSEPGFSERELRAARGVADITSLAIGNAGRFLELERAYVSTVEVLANALEAKDAYTGGHARALAEMALAMGAEMGFEPDRLKRLELGALFHDIGKIGVGSEIIRKPGPLTAEEREEMNRHPEIGEQILAPVPFLQSIRPIIRACHERWDGGGYPDGLKEEEIPLEARIVFVCDAYHAMTTDRSYRKALAEEEAIRRLELAAGSQFDPVAVEVFVRLHAAGGISHSH